MSSDVFTPLSIQSYINSYNLNAIFSTFFGLFCIFIILRYSNQSITETGYHFHLLNMAIWTLICDLSLAFLFQFYILLPLNGFCGVGKLKDLLTGWMETESIMKVHCVSKLYFKSGKFFKTFREYLLSCCW